MQRVRPAVIVAVASSIAMLAAPVVASAELGAVPAWTVDTDYGVDGLARLDGVYDADLVVMPNGRAYVLAEDVESPGEVSLVRFTATGELDEGFGGDGFVLLPGVGPLEHLQMDLQQTPDGPRLVVAKWATTRDFVPVYRFRLNGAPDWKFGRGGFVVVDIGREMTVRGLTVTDDRIVPFGECPTRPFTSYPCLIVLTADGARDNRFDKDGFKVWKTPGKGVSIDAAAMAPDGSRIYVGERARGERSWMLGALDPGGRPVAEFGVDGLVRQRPECGRTSFGVRALHLMASGDLVAAGGNCKHTGMARFTAAGDLVADYGEGGWVAFPDGGRYLATVQDPETETVHWMHRGDDGDFHLGGVLPDGSPDPAFGPTNELVVDLEPDSTGFWSYGLDRDREGRLYAKAWYPDDIAFRGIVIARVMQADGVGAPAGT